MLQKIESLEKAGSLQVKHLDAMSESEEELKRNKSELELQLKGAADENRGLQEQLSQAAIDTGTMTQMALQLQALDDQNRALREEIATTQDRAGSQMIEIGLQNDALVQALDAAQAADQPLHLGRTRCGAQLRHGPAGARLLGRCRARPLG